MATRLEIQTSRDTTRDEQEGQWFAEAYRLPIKEDNGPIEYGSFHATEQAAIDELLAAITAKYENAHIKIA